MGLLGDAGVDEGDGLVVVVGEHVAALLLVVRLEQADRGLVAHAVIILCRVITTRDRDMRTAFSLSCWVAIALLGGCNRPGSGPTTERTNGPSSLTPVDT